MTTREPSQPTSAKKGEMAEPVDQRLASAFVPSAIGDHIESGDWERLIDSGLTATERASVVEHLTSCRECALVYRGLLEFDTLARDFDPDAPKRESGAGSLDAFSFRRRWLLRTGVSLAIAATLVIGVGLIRERSRPAAFRGGNETAVRLLPSDGALNPEGRISWSAAPGVLSYRITVFSEDGRVISRIQVNGSTSVAWPMEAEAPGVYFWRVSAAESLASSPDAEVALSLLGRVEIRR
jgi:hypothetical protein